METLDTLIALIATTARLAAAKLIAAELEDLFARPDVAAFAATWFAGSASDATLRRELVRDLRALADLAAAKASDDLSDGNVDRAAKRLAVSSAIGCLVVVVQNGSRFGGRSLTTNDARFVERKAHLARAFGALRAA